MILSSELTETLNKKALSDLIRRALAGSFVYPLIWIAIGFMKGLHNTHPRLLFVNLCITSLLAAIRASLAFVPKQTIDEHYKNIARLFEITVVFQGFHFSCLTIYVYFTNDLQSLIFPMAISAAGTVTAGATTLGINKCIRFLFPTAFMLPMVVVLMWYFSFVNLLVSILIVISFSYIILSTKRVYQDYWRAITNEALLEQRASELERKMKEIEVLSGLLPICSSCKKIRDDKGYWNRIENYIEKHSSAQFSHGICEECSDKLYGDETWYKELKKTEIRMKPDRT